jgi:hypothetical protein
MRDDIQWLEEYTFRQWHMLASGLARKHTDAGGRRPRVRPLDIAGGRLPGPSGPRDRSHGCKWLLVVRVTRPRSCYAPVACHTTAVVILPNLARNVRYEQLSSKPHSCGPRTRLNPNGSWRP